jgi:hypothetical protein
VAAVPLTLIVQLGSKRLGATGAGFGEVYLQAWGHRLGMTLFLNRFLPLEDQAREPSPAPAPEAQAQEMSARAFSIGCRRPYRPCSASAWRIIM